MSTNAGTVSFGNVPAIGTDGIGTIAVPVGLSYFGIDNTTGAPFVALLPAGIPASAPPLTIKVESNNAPALPGRLSATGGQVDAGFGPSQWIATARGQVTLQPLGNNSWSTV